MDSFRSFSLTFGLSFEFVASHTGLALAFFRVGVMLFPNFWHDASYQMTGNPTV